jgi:hypothetical protein
MIKNLKLCKAHHINCTKKIRGTTSLSQQIAYCVGINSQPAGTTTAKKGKDPEGAFL